ncbi:unnamed protein product [Diamesa hyperborea]
MAFLSRTHAIKAALVLGFLLIFLNLIGLRLDIKFDRSSVNLAHHVSNSLQWPKRTHTNQHAPQQNQQHHKLSNPLIEQLQELESLNATNKYTSSLLNNTLSTLSLSSSVPATTNNNKNNLNNTNNKVNFNSNNNNNNNNTNDSSRDINRENGDITISNNRMILNNNSNKIVVISNNSSVESSSNPALIHELISEVPIVIKESVPKYLLKGPHKKKINTDFDDSLVKKDGILSSIMKVFGLNQCPIQPPNLEGPIEVDVGPEFLENVEKRLAPLMQLGGRFKPKDCRARDRVAVVVPFRDRKQHLPILLKNLHPFLMKQQIDYGIFLVEQTNDGSFNRAKLMNVGFVEALKLYEWDCFVFHDVDLLPMDDRNLYNCPSQPRHMSVAVDTFGFKLPYSSIFGGVSSMTSKQFKTVNGFSNSFWGWGGEDDDLSRRLKHVGYHISRYPVNIARYKMLLHKKEKANPRRYEKLVTGANRFNSDGLNSLKYKVIDLQLKPLYTWIHVEITPENVSKKLRSKASA